MGWGRWDARRRGGALSARDPQGTLPPSFGAGIPISKSGGWGQERARANMVESVGRESIHFSHDDYDTHLMLEMKADKMFVDGSASASCSETPDDDVVMNDDPEDVTDDEDWAAMGAAALRAESYPIAQSGGTLGPPNFALPGGLRPFSVSAGMGRPPPAPANLGLLALEGTSDAQEREAVEALLRLGSV